MMYNGVEIDSMDLAQLGETLTDLLDPVDPPVDPWYVMNQVADVMEDEIERTDHTDMGTLCAALFWFAMEGSAEQQRAAAWALKALYEEAERVRKAKQEHYIRYGTLKERPKPKG